MALQGFLRYLLKRPDIRSSRILSDFLAADEMLSQSTTPTKLRPSLAAPTPTKSHRFCHGEDTSSECETAEARRAVARRLDLATDPNPAGRPAMPRTQSSSIRKSTSADALSSLGLVARERHYTSGGQEIEAVARWDVATTRLRGTPSSPEKHALL